MNGGFSQQMTQPPPPLGQLQQNHQTPNHPGHHQIVHQVGFGPYSTLVFPTRELNRNLILFFPERPPFHATEATDLLGAVLALESGLRQECPSQQQPGPQPPQEASAAVLRWGHFENKDIPRENLLLKNK